MYSSIGIVICNYNKQDYIVNCIQSVLESSIDDYTIYVVDNASTDQSVASIQKAYDDKITLIVNKENLGGSGGFNTGIREALLHQHKYIMLMDNDIIADKKAIEELYLFLERNPQVGIVGSKVFFMDEPTKIWGNGGIIDFEKYVQKDLYKNEIDGEHIPEVVYCDYVAACSLMARADAIREIGLMPEENFIYWDDMEWGYRFRNNGYLVAVYGKSKIWHKAGGRNAENTFIHYYMWRNRIRFFLKVLDQDKQEHFAQNILEEVFRMIYSCNLKGEFNIIHTLMFALDDSIHGVSGKATEGKILPRVKVVDRLQATVSQAENVLFSFNGNYEGLGNIMRTIKKSVPNIKIAIAIDKNLVTDYEKEKEKLQRQYSEVNIVEEYRPEAYQKHFIMCEHIFKIEDLEEDCYIDPWCNIIETKDDFKYASNFSLSRDLFVLCTKNLLLSAKGDIMLAIEGIVKNSYGK